MNRRSFIRNLLGTALTLGVAPGIFVPKLIKPRWKPLRTYNGIPIDFENSLISATTREMFSEQISPILTLIYSSELKPLGEIDPDLAGSPLLGEVINGEFRGIYLGGAASNCGPLESLLKL